MKKYVLCLLIIFIFYATPKASNPDNWHIAKSRHFIVYYKHASDDFIERLIEKSEDYYDEIAEALGFRRYNFWLWDNRAKIYVYDNLEDYQSATGQPPWSHGATIPRDKIIYTYLEAKGFFDTILPHEMGHIIFREFVGFDNYAVPLWLDEGVASYQENLRYSIAKRLVIDAVKQGSFIDLERLSNLNPQLMLDNTSVNLFYAEATSIIDYLVKEFGKDNFVLFCQNLRDKKNLEKALVSSYPFRDIQGLDRAWQRFLKHE